MEIEIDKKDAHYLMKLIRNGRFKVDEILAVKPKEPFKEIWEETLKANERLECALEKAIQNDRGY